MASNEYVTAAEAQEMLGVSKPRMAEILGSEPGAGILKWERSRVDGRVKLIRRADVEALAVEAPGRSKNAA